MMSINPFSAGQPSQASHFNHYSSPSTYTYPPTTIAGPPSTADLYSPESEADGRLIQRRSQSSFLPPHLPVHVSPHRSSKVPSTNRGAEEEFTSMLDKRSKSMTSEAPLSVVQKARKASSPALSRRRKRSDSGDNNLSDEKDEAGAAGNVTMFQCRGFGECQMVFTRSEHLARHVRKHTGERPFQCHCGKAFSRLDNLRQHAQTVHSDEQERNESMMQQLTSLHSSLAASAAQAQVAHAQVLGKFGTIPVSTAFVPLPSGPSVESTRRKSSMTVPANKKRASLASTPRRDSILSQSSAPSRSVDEAYFADQKEMSSPSNYYQSYPEGAAAVIPSVAPAISNGQAALLSNGNGDGFHYTRSTSNLGAYTTFGHSTFGHDTIVPQDTPYYAQYDHQALYTAPPSSSLVTTTPATQFAHMESSGLGEYNAYPPSLSHSYHQGEPNEWRNHEVGPRGEDHFHGESSAPKSNFQSTLSAHLAMRAPVLRPGRGVSPPSTAHSMRPSSSSSIGPLDRPTLPPLSSLSRPNTSHSNSTTPITFNPIRHPSQMEASQISFFNRGHGDDRRPNTSPAEPLLISRYNGDHHQADRPMLPSVKTTSAIRPGSRGSVLDPPNLFESSNSRIPLGYNRGTLAAGHETIIDRLRTSPPSSNSPFRFQPPPLPNQSGANTSLRPISRDRPMTGHLPSLSTTLDSLKRSRDLRGREENYASKRLRPFTSGDLPAPSRFAARENITVLKEEDAEDGVKHFSGSRRVSIASLIEDHDEQASPSGPSNSNIYGPLKIEEIEEQ